MWRIFFFSTGLQDQEHQYSRVTPHKQHDGWSQPWQVVHVSHIHHGLITFTAMLDWSLLWQAGYIQPRQVGHSRARQLDNTSMTSCVQPWQIGQGPGRLYIVMTGWSQPGQVGHSHDRSVAAMTGRSQLCQAEHSHDRSVAAITSLSKPWQVGHSHDRSVTVM
jgi:hypothetical protein